MPDEVISTSYNHRNFAERMDSLYRFVRHLHDVDVHEVRQLMSENGAQKRYFESYGPVLFSSTMARSLAGQVAKVGSSILRRWRNDDGQRHPVEEVLERWVSLAHLNASEDRAIVDALQNLGSR